MVKAKHLRVLIPKDVNVTQYHDWIMCVGAPNKPLHPKHRCYWVAVQGYEDRATCRHRSETFNTQFGTACIDMSNDNLRLINHQGDEYAPHT